MSRFAYSLGLIFCLLLWSVHQSTDFTLGQSKKHHLAPQTQADFLRIYMANIYPLLSNSEQALVQQAIHFLENEGAATQPWERSSDNFFLMNIIRYLQLLSDSEVIQKRAQYLAKQSEVMAVIGDRDSVLYEGNVFVTSKSVGLGQTDLFFRGYLKQNPRKKHITFLELAGSYGDHLLDTIRNTPDAHRVRFTLTDLSLRSFIAHQQDSHSRIVFNSLGQVQSVIFKGTSYTDAWLLYLTRGFKGLLKEEVFAFIEKARQVFLRENIVGRSPLGDKASRIISDIPGWVFERVELYNNQLNKLEGQVEVKEADIKNLADCEKSDVIRTMNILGYFSAEKRLLYLQNILSRLNKGGRLIFTLHDFYNTPQDDTLVLDKHPAQDLYKVVSKNISTDWVSEATLMATLFKSTGITYDIPPKMAELSQRLDSQSQLNSVLISA